MTFADPLIQRALRSRRTVLGAALVAGLAIALATGGTTERATLIADAQAQDSVRIRVAAEAKDGEDTSSAASAKPEGSPTRGHSVDAEISISDSGVTIRKGDSRGHEHHEVVLGDMEFDSFDEFVEKAPWLAALVFGVVALLFLTPVLLVLLIIWYKMRANRLRNETMLKLAERGVVPPADAVAAVGTPGAQPIDALPPSAPLYAHAREIRKRAAWSDLRKGVVMIGIGLGLVFWSMLDGGEPNGFGLILLFVGIGYVVLWHFESRQLDTRDGTGPTAGGR